MVNFIGAGPGAADLITLRGAELLKEADIIIYAGSLVNKELLGFAKPGCEFYDSAKMTLEDVISVIAENTDKSIARLHTGDPSIYGAIREQIDELERLGIEYAVCPGVSSMFGAAAALGAEYTLPGVSQSVIITRMAGRTAVPERESIASLSAHGATMVVFLSAAMAEELSKELISGGYPPETPAAIVYKATRADERVIRTTVGELAAAARQSGITKTALIAVGGFLGGEYERSRLYDPSFSHGFRGDDGR